METVSFKTDYLGAKRRFALRLEECTFNELCARIGRKYNVDPATLAIFTTMDDRTVNDDNTLRATITESKRRAERCVQLDLQPQSSIGGLPAFLTSAVGSQQQQHQQQAIIEDGTTTTTGTSEEDTNSNNSSSSEDDEDGSLALLSKLEAELAMAKAAELAAKEEVVKAKQTLFAARAQSHLARASIRDLKRAIRQKTGGKAPRDGQDDDIIDDGQEGCGRRRFGRGHRRFGGGGSRRRHELGPYAQQVTVEQAQTSARSMTAPAPVEATSLPEPLPPFFPGSVVTLSPSGSSDVLTAAEDGLIRLSTATSDLAKFVVVTSSDGGIKLRNLQTGNFLRIRRRGAVDVLGQGGRWTCLQVEDLNVQTSTFRLAREGRYFTHYLVLNADGQPAATTQDVDQATLIAMRVVGQVEVTAEEQQYYLARGTDEWKRNDSDEDDVGGCRRRRSGRRHFQH